VSYVTGIKCYRPGQLDSKALGATINTAGPIAGFARSNKLCYVALYISLTLTLTKIKEKKRKKKSQKEKNISSILAYCNAGLPGTAGR
jgi:hypothetical protein